MKCAPPTFADCRQYSFGPLCLAVLILLYGYVSSRGCEDSSQLQKAAMHTDFGSGTSPGNPPTTQKSALIYDTCICVVDIHIPDLASPISLAELEILRHAPDFTSPKHAHPSLERRRARTRAAIFAAYDNVVVHESCVNVCAYVFESSSNFAFATSLVAAGSLSPSSYRHEASGSYWTLRLDTETARMRQQSSYRHEASGNYWTLQKDTETARMRRQSSPSLSPVEPHIRCWYGSCGWDRPIILRPLLGRYGNSVTQFAAVFAASWDYNYTLVLGKQDSFEGPAGFAYEFAIASSYTMEATAGNARQDHRDSSRIIEHIGFSECYMYHWDALEVIKPLTEVDEQLFNVSQARHRMHRIRKEHPTSEIVAFHMRHGDKANADAYFQPTTTYLRRAISIIREKTRDKPLLLVVVAENSHAAFDIVAPLWDLPYIFYSLPGPSTTALEDMAFARMADHFIWSVGTFSYWISTHIPRDGVRVSVAKHWKNTPFNWQDFIPPNVHVITDIE